MFILLNALQYSTQLELVLQYLDCTKLALTLTAPAKTLNKKIYQYNAQADQFQELQYKMKTEFRPWNSIIKEFG